MQNKWLRIALSVVAILTLFIPTDLLPDFAPIVGWIDDAVAASYLFVELLRIIEQRKSR